MTDQELDSINEQVAKALGIKPDAVCLPCDGSHVGACDYSRSIEAAWEIVEWMVANKQRIVFGWDKDWGWRYINDPDVGSEYAPTAPLAICKSFLKLKELEKVLA